MGAVNELGTLNCLLLSHLRLGAFFSPRTRQCHGRGCDELGALRQGSGLAQIPPAVHLRGRQTPVTSAHHVRSREIEKEAGRQCRVNLLLCDFVGTVGRGEYLGRLSRGSWGPQVWNGREGAGGCLEVYNSDAGGLVLRALPTFRTDCLSGR